MCALRARLEVALHRRVREESLLLVRRTNWVLVQKVGIYSLLVDAQNQFVFVPRLIFVVVAAAVTYLCS